MKKLSLALLMLFITFRYASAQSEYKKDQFREGVWGKKNPAFEVMEVPEKWKNESVVFLAKSVEYEIERQGFLTILDEQFTMRSRIKIMDNDGVKKYSELEFEVPRSDYARYYNNNVSYQTKFFFGAKIVKSDGKEILLKEEDLVRLEVKNNQDKFEKYKIAIPELEAQDIIDYYFGLQMPRLVSTFFESESFDFWLAGTYPSLYQEYNVILNKKCYLNADSYNGAPEFQLLNRERNRMHYQLVDVEREKFKSERWADNAKTVPFIKFKAFYCHKEKYISLGSFPNLSAKVNKPISKGDYLEFVNELTHTTPMWWRVTSRFFLVSRSYEHPDVTSAHRYLRKYYKNETDPLKKAEAAYYYLRHHDLAASYEYKLLYNQDPGYRVRDPHFARIFSRVLEKNKIAHDILFCVLETRGMDIKNAIHSDDLKMLVAVIGKNKQKVYFDSYTRFTNPGEIDAAIEGVPAYSIRMVKKKKERKVQEAELPVSSFEDNKEEKVAKVVLELDSEPSLVIQRTSTITGHRKSYIQNELATGYNYIDRAQRNHLENLDLDRYYLLSYKERKAVPQKKKEVREENEKAILESYKKEIQSDIPTEQVEVEELKLETIGIWNDDSEFVYAEKLVVKDFVKRAGPNYLLEMGKLIGSQIALEEKEKERTTDLRLEYARTFKNVIELEVPKGYRAEGLDKFNFKVENQSGAFVSQAKQEGNKVIISCQKSYKKAKVEKEQWNEMVAFLDAAYSFTQQKLLIKKEILGMKN